MDAALEEKSFIFVSALAHAELQLGVLLQQSDSNEILCSAFDSLCLFHRVGNLVSACFRFYMGQILRRRSSGKEMGRGLGLGVGVVVGWN